MNRYHQIYFNYLSKIQSTGRAWSFAQVGITGILQKIEYQAQAFPFEGIDKRMLQFKPTFKVEVLVENPVGETSDSQDTTIIFYIEVSGNKVIADMDMYRRCKKYYPEVLIMPVGRNFFEMKQNVKNLKDIGVWIDPSPREKRKVVDLSAVGPNHDSATNEDNNKDGIAIDENTSIEYDIHTGKHKLQPHNIEVEVIDNNIELEQIHFEIPEI